MKPSVVAAAGQVKPESKLYLLNFRKQAGIDSQEHLIAVEKQASTPALVSRTTSHQKRCLLVSTAM